MRLRTAAVRRRDHAFRRFKDMLATSPAQLRRYWLLSAERQYGRAWA
ncbi:hypothetical protein ACWCQZ_47985 [Streptomyces sp. NPDC002285]